jgi:hypothetical protein
MSQDPAPSAGQGAQEPDDWDAEASILSLAAAIDAGQYEIPPEAPPEQGLYLSVSPEQLTLEGFAQDGITDTMTPGPLLATVVDSVTGEDAAGLAVLSDNQLMGVISAARRLECRATWTQLAAIAEFATRRQDPARPGGPRSRRGSPLEFAADELAGELHLTWIAAAAQISYATTVAARLPRCFAALAAGRLHPFQLRIIEDETRYLSDEDAARADEILAGTAGSKTFAQLRYAAHRLVLTLDPAAAQRRKDEAKREAHVRRFREDSGNAGMMARELPSDEVLASWQHVEQRALDLRAAGMPGTLQELRVRAYLDLLQERDSRTPQADQQQPASDTAASESTSPGTDGTPGRSEPGDSSHPGCPGISGTPGGHGKGDPGPSIAALVTITVPLATIQGRSGAPGEAGGFGLLDAQDARDAVAAAARHPRTRWCLTALNPDGTAAAHACAAGPHRIIPAGPDPPASSPPPLQRLIARLRDRLAAVAWGSCDHRHAESGYQPSRKLAHLVSARSAQCTAPGCGRPAARCDQDHTLAWQKGGITCQCNLAPLCRHHHRCKQAEGWHLEQPEPGVLVWRVPSGRTYTTTPTEHSV